MDIISNETFGSVVSVIRIDSVDEAVRLANDTVYGLPAVVLTHNVSRALDTSAQLEAGMVHINNSTVMDESITAFGGINASGTGGEGSHYSIETMAEPKWITLQRVDTLMSA